MAIKIVRQRAVSDEQRHDAGVEQQFYYSTVRNVKDTNPVLIDASWADFVVQTEIPEARGELPLDEYLLADKATQSAQKDGAAWTPACFAAESNRNDAGVIRMYGFVGDFDNDCGDYSITGDFIQSKMQSHIFCAHTTYSHSRQKEKWRLIVPFKDPVSPQDYATIFDHFNDLFFGALDPACKNPSHIFFLPSCPKDALDLYVRIVGNG